MQVHVYGIVLLALTPCSSASRIRRSGDKGSDEGLFVPPPGVRLPAAWPAMTGPRAVPGHAASAVRLHAVAASGEPQGEPGPNELELMRMRLQKSWMLPSMTTGTNLAPDRILDGFQVLTDLDDTIFSSSGGPSGIDESFYKHETYPGAFQFMLELSRGPFESMKPSKVFPFLANPEELTDIMSLKKHVFLESKRVGKINGLPNWGLKPQEGLYAKVFNNGFESKPIVFVGDNGKGKGESQADRMAMEAGDLLQAAFIHDVRHAKEKGKQAMSDKIYLFDTYYDAARKAFELGLISQAGMKRVEQAFASASIVQMCQHQDMFTDGRYPCIRWQKGKAILIDAVTRQPFPGLTLNIDDGTATFQECQDAGTPVTTPLIVPSQDGSRCASISRVMDSLSLLGSLESRIA